MKTLTIEEPFGLGMGWDWDKYVAEEMRRGLPSGAEIVSMIPGSTGFWGWKTMTVFYK